MIIHAAGVNFNPRSIAPKQWFAIRLIAGLIALLFVIYLNSTAFSGAAPTSLRHAFRPTPKAIPHRSGEDPYAYVFYATEDTYACSALVNIDILRSRSKHPIYMLVTQSVSDGYVESARSRGVIVIVETPPPLTFGVEYYHDVLLKLIAFKMHHYVPHLRRIITMDADQLVLGDLDLLFELPSVPFAAPRAYWLPGGPISSTLMVIELSNSTWEKVSDGMQHLAADKYDMDLMQDLFTNDVLMLPGQFASINSHWEAWDLPTWFTGGAELERVPEGQWHTNITDQRFIDLYSASQLLHFYAVGKPWNYPGNAVRSSRPGAHWLLAEQFELWRELANKSCPGDPNATYMLNPPTVDSDYGAGNVESITDTALVSEATQESLPTS